MIVRKQGKVIKGLGGLYTTKVTLSDGSTELYTSHAKGTLKRDEDKVLVGDNVIITFDEKTKDSAVISEVLPRKNALVRPPMANLDYLFIVLAAKRPTPALDVIDKLTAIAVHNSIIPVIVITKSDLSESIAAEYAEIYEKSGFPTFVTSSDSKEGIEELSSYINIHIKDGATAAFAGASGVGKSTLLNTLFPSLSLFTGELSRKTERGRHTTRHVEIFDIDGGGLFADTPSFSLIDFARFDFFDIEELTDAFPDISLLAGDCRYADCTHFGEGRDECAVARAAEEGRLPESRLRSYREIYRVLKFKKNY